MKVGGDANIADAVFEGWVQFSRVNIASDFEAIGTKFQNKESGADFRGTRVGGNAVFNGAVFEGVAQFDAAEIAGNFKAGAKFQQWASFERMKVEEQRKDFEAALAREQKQIEALTAGLQKVSAQLEVSKAAPQVVKNP
jgi:hypothetical protein